MHSGPDGVADRRRHLLDDHVEERRQVLALVGELADGEALAARGVDDGEVELVVAGAQRHEQIEHRVHDLLGLDAGPIDLVDHDQGRQAHLEGLLGDEPGLGHRPLVGVDDQEHGVDHAEHALDLTAEVGVAGRVDQVDPHALPGHRGALRQDRDAALALEIVRVHGPLGDDLPGAEGAGAPEQPVDQGGLAVVDVGDDGDVADVGL
jgi:hypothetical protein